MSSLKWNCGTFLKLIVFVMCHRFVKINLKPILIIYSSTCSISPVFIDKKLFMDFNGY